MNRSGTQRPHWCGEMATASYTTGGFKIMGPGETLHTSAFASIIPSVPSRMSALAIIYWMNEYLQNFYLRVTNFLFSEKKIFLVIFHQRLSTFKTNQYYTGENKLSQRDAHVLFREYMEDSSICAVYITYKIQ